MQMLRKTTKHYGRIALDFKCETAKGADNRFGVEPHLKFNETNKNLMHTPNNNSKIIDTSLFKFMIHILFLKIFKFSVWLMCVYLYIC